jgi:hypothetical protein
MTGKVFTVAIILTYFLSVLTQAATYGGGSGTTSDPYLISTPEQLNMIGANSGDWASCFKLMDDIDMSAYTSMQYNIIGNKTTPFTGVFNGNGYVIRNLTYSTATEVNYVGLFGFTNNATIKNLGVEDINLYTGGRYAGGLVGYLYYGTITNCYSTGSVTSSYISSSNESYVGALVEQQHSGADTSYSNSGLVILSLPDPSSPNSSYAGGLVGFCYGTITYSYSMATVTSSANGPSSYRSLAGGLVGYLHYGVITNCYSTGLVNSSAYTSDYSYAGGLVAGNHHGTISMCYSISTMICINTYHSTYAITHGYRVIA